MTFTDKLKQAVSAADSCLCVGLDPNLDRIPPILHEQFPDKGKLVAAFLKQVIDATSENCAAYKPNLGFFEALGDDGLAVLREVINYIPDGKIVIADAKRGDISSTARHYAKAYFEVFDVDAITVNPLMGFESLDPFLDYPGKAVYTLALTSNPGAADFLTRPFAGEDSIASYISKRLAELQGEHTTHLGMVVGATRAGSIKDVISHHPTASLLMPGIGSQGGSVDSLAGELEGHPGIPLVNSSRSILYAGEGSEEWQDEVRQKAAGYQKELEPITRNYV